MIQKILSYSHKITFHRNKICRKKFNFLAYINNKLYFLLLCLYMCNKMRAFKFKKLNLINKIESMQMIHVKIPFFVQKNIKIT